MHFLLALLLATTTPAPTADEQFRVGQQLVQPNADADSLKRAVTALQEALRLGYSDAIAAHHLLLAAYRGLGDMPSAKREAEAIMAADPSDGDARLAWIETLPPKQQLTELQSMAEKSPNDSIFQLMISHAAFTAGDFALGVKSARKWLDGSQIKEQQDLLPTLFADRSEAELQEILKADGTLYPAHLMLAGILLAKPGPEAYEQLREFYRDAPAPIATAYSAAIFKQLKAANRSEDGLKLLREFSTKLEEGAMQKH